jgi:plastocyanin
VTANWQRIINELSYENNARAALVTIPHEQSDVLITIDGQSASPDPVTLTQGQTVVFQNTDNVPLQVSWTAGGVTVSYTVKASSYSVLIIFDEIGTFTYTVEQAVGTSNSQPGKGAGKSKAHNGNNNVPVTGTIIVQVVGQAAQRVSTSSMQTAVLSGTGLVMALFGALFVFVAFRYSKRSSEKKPLLEKQELKNIKQ